ncbi:MAG: NADH-quinone oxidoreductase subunit NuoG [Acidimicrobiia bacterium]|nr:NADH-quinone oxidoreductase subunit NuoG [Acidimicrobiia bacterium]
MSERITITIDGVEREVDADQMLIAAAEQAGTYIPRFCWHPRMKEVGMCRQCLVEVEGPRGVMLVPSCTMPVNDGMVVHTESDTAKKAQEGILEFLLINHPLDCPVCDKGGECPLQDQAFSHGPGESRFVEEKRHYEKPIPVNDLVLLDRERCILCARCTRFSEEISGDPYLEFKQRGNDTQVSTFPTEPFSSYFSGNTVQICPVGALTSKAYRFKARPWDLKEVASVNPITSTGDSVSLQASQNEVVRIIGVDNDGTNHGWLDDRSRFGFGWITSSDRLTKPLMRSSDGTHQEIGWGDAVATVAEQLLALVEEQGPGSIAAIGGARGTNEDAYALARFMRSVVGSPHLDARLGDALGSQFLAALAGKGRINDLESAKTILLWGPDLKEEHPVLYLRVRRAAQELGATLITVHPRATGLDDRAALSFSYTPGTGHEVLAGLIAGKGDYAAAREALDEGPVVAIVGRTGLAEDPSLAEAVAAFARDLPDASVLPLARRGNTFGALDMGVAPDLLPGRVAAGGDAPEAWGEATTSVGMDTEEILAAAAAGKVKALLLVGADPLRDAPDPELAQRAFEAADLVVSLDCFLTDSSAAADLVLPAAAFGEKEGTVTNLEGRVQKVNTVVPAPGQSRADWSILDDVSERMGAPMGLGSAEAISREIAAVAPAYQGVSWFLLDWKERDGVVVPREGAEQPLEYVPVATDVATSASKKGFALHLARVLYDDAVLTRHSAAIADQAPGPFAALHPDDVKKLGANGHVSVDGHVLPLHHDPSLAVGTVHVPFNQPGGPALAATASVTVKAASVSGERKQ